jgi:phage tail sheath protein FI
MPRHLAPGVFVPEIEPGPTPIVGVATSTAAILGQTGRGPLSPRLVTSFAEYESLYGSVGAFLPAAMRGFFENGGKRAYVCRLRGPDGLARALAALEDSAFREVALVAAPGLVAAEETGALIDHCEARRRFAVLDCPRADPALLDPRGGRQSSHAAAYAPWLQVAAPGGGGQMWAPPSGAVLGVYARTDVERGVWAAPANQSLLGVTGLEHDIDQGLQEQLNPHGVNVIRRFTGRGIRVWGARTLSTDAEWKYVNVRRLQLFLERSIEEGMQWVLFEPNDEALWMRVRRQVEQFLHAQWHSGAFPGDRPQSSYYVKCDRTTMTQSDLDSGRLIVEIGFAPARPAEFVLFRIGQWTADARS